MPHALITAAVQLDPAPERLLAQARPLVARPERLDTLCTAGLASASAALSAAGLTPAALAARPHALLLGTALGCLESDHAYYRQILDLGLRRTNPRVFAYTLPNVVLGEVAIALALTGEQLALSAGRASALTALTEAFHLIRSGVIETALILALDVTGPATRLLFDALGTRPQPIVCALVLEAAGSRPTARPLARVTAARAGFDPRATAADPPVDPLGAAGLKPLLAALATGPLRQPLTLEARCETGPTAHLDLVAP